MSKRYRRTGGHWPPCATHADEAVWRWAIHLRDGLRCVYCGLDLRTAPPKAATLDHLRRGGGHDPSNVVSACRSCNSKRQTRAWRSFASVRVITRILQLRSQPIDLELARLYLHGAVDGAAHLASTDTWTSERETFVCACGVRARRHVGEPRFTCTICERAAQRKEVAA
jgi:hypothetical protein